MEYYPKPNILYENLIPEQQVYKAFKHLPYLEFKEQAGTASLSTQYTTPPCTCLTSHVEALVTTITHVDGEHLVDHKLQDTVPQSRAIGCQIKDVP